MLNITVTTDTVPTPEDLKDILEWIAFCVEDSAEDNGGKVLPINGEGIVPIAFSFEVVVNTLDWRSQRKS